MLDGSSDSIRGIHLEIVEVNFDNSSSFFDGATHEVDFNRKAELLWANEEFGCVCECNFTVDKSLFFAVIKMLLVFPDLYVKVHTLLDSEADLIHFQ